LLFTIRLRFVYSPSIHRIEASLRTSLLGSGDCAVKISDPAFLSLHPALRASNSHILRLVLFA
jgi:hypothetical protein